MYVHIHVHLYVISLHVYDICITCSESATTLIEILYLMKVVLVNPTLKINTVSINTDINTHVHVYICMNAYSCM